jgi:hypothetical protein
MAIKVIVLSLSDVQATAEQMELDTLLNEGYQVIGSGVQGMSQAFTLYKPDGGIQPTAKPQPQNTQVLNIESIECRETLSKSTNQYFKFWSCVDKFGAKVNIFDHPDISRNTFNIMKAADWGHWAEMAVGETNELDTPLPMLVSHDGEWASLVSVTPRYAYMELCNYYDGMLDEAEDIPFPRADTGVFIDGDYIPTNDDERESPLSLDLYGDELEGDE